MLKNIKEFNSEFPDADACRAFLRDMRWPDGVACPRCGEKDRVYAMKSRPSHWLCKSGKTTTDADGKPVTCLRKSGYRFSVITGTIFQDTKIPLDTWFKVAYLILSSKKGISALQIHRIIFGEESGSDYRTSWFMCHRIRAAMKGDIISLLEGEIEVDEVYIGGKDRNRHYNKKSRQQRNAGTAFGYGKTGVIGAIARKGNVVCQMMEDADFTTYNGFVRKVVGNVDLVATDENASYNYLGYGAKHQAVRHSSGEYVRGNVHTNSIESFWALLKRGVVGTFHNVSKEYLPLYLAEFSWRHNNRKNPEMFSLLIQSV
jgi:transposase-like protein